MAKTAKVKKLETKAKAKLKQGELPLTGANDQMWMHPPNGCDLKGSIFILGLKLSVSPTCPRCKAKYTLKMTGDKG